MTNERKKFLSFCFLEGLASDGVFALLENWVFTIAQAVPRSKTGHENDLSAECIGLGPGRRSEHVVGFTTVGRINSSVEGKGSFESCGARDSLCFGGEVSACSVGVGE